MTISSYRRADRSLRRLRTVLAACLLAPAGALAGSSAAPPDVTVTVYKSATCGCCSAWVDYLRDRGLAVDAHDVDDLDAVKARFGVHGQLRSCHTATAGGYVIEGHVPVGDILRLLAEQPSIAGLSAPGMPPQSPGMGSDEPKDYDVLAFTADGEVSVFSRH